MNIYLPVFLVYGISMPDPSEVFTAPTVPASGSKLMPEADTFTEGLLMIIKDIMPLIRPDFYEASRVLAALVAVAMLISVLQNFSEQIKKTSDYVAAASISAILLLSTNSLIRLGDNTVSEMTEYGKLLLPVMTAAMAAQGNVGASSALYAAASTVIAIVSSVMSTIFVPVIYMFLAVAAAHTATGEDLLKKLKVFMKESVSWCLKTVLTGFMGFMSVTGVISGTADAGALKATKAAISTVVPVVGGILSEASEAVLIGVGIAKNAAGLYGLFAILAICLGPFIKICCHYMILKIASALCCVFGSKNISELVSDFSSAMGLLLAMTGSVCLLLLISTVCFMKGVT